MDVSATTTEDCNHCWHTTTASVSSTGWPSQVEYRWEICCWCGRQRYVTVRLEHIPQEHGPYAPENLWTGTWSDANGTSLSDSVTIHGSNATVSASSWNEGHSVFPSHQPGCGCDPHGEVYG